MPAFLFEQHFEASKDGSNVVVMVTKNQSLKDNMRTEWH